MKNKKWKMKYQSNPAIRVVRTSLIILTAEDVMRECLKHTVILEQQQLKIGLIFAVSVSKMRAMKDALQLLNVRFL